MGFHPVAVGGNAAHGGKVFGGGHFPARRADAGGVHHFVPGDAGGGIHRCHVIHRLPVDGKQQGLPAVVQNRVCPADHVGGGCRGLRCRDGSNRCGGADAGEGKGGEGGQMFVSFHCYLIECYSIRGLYPGGLQIHRDGLL